MDIGAFIVYIIEYLYTIEFSFTFFAHTFTLSIFDMFLSLLVGSLVITFINHLLWE